METSSKALQESTCSCCAESCPLSDCEWIPMASLNLNCLQSTADFDSMAPRFSHHMSGFNNIILEPSGICQISNEPSAYEINLCLSCLRAIQKGKTPVLALANGTYRFCTF